jgi:hypothetical protein
MNKLIISIDPGKTSGFCLVTWTGKQENLPILERSSELLEDNFASDIKVALAMTKWYEITVVCERFTITAQTTKNSQAPYSLEQIGVLKHLCREAGYDPDKIVFQSPVDAKNMFPNPALKKIGTWHVGGAGHANDAIRHALLRLTKTGWVPRILLS